ncbi:hypothetical protein DICVIV_10764 [Dictyocaulus viviparus]|uniref:Uncharacterized protein n=1 Tax=Dictyocaulus viviparus TaxID=29172 RepID=A0A0D8XF85_DICVI|nr:hypothetical protein DICVIV_10764 [Dictyocaulus viviparus]
MTRELGVRLDEKYRHRTCCSVCHIKFGTTILGVIEAVVSIAVLITAAQQVIFLLFCGILFDTSCLLFPHIIIQGIFLLFSIGYFCLYAVSYFYGDLHIHSRDFQDIEENRRRRESAFARCSERVRLAKENGLWRRTSWGGGFQQYKGEYDENKPKKSGKRKEFHVQWDVRKQSEEEGGELDQCVQSIETPPNRSTIQVESIDETEDSDTQPHHANQSRSSLKADHISPILSDQRKLTSDIEDERTMRNTSTSKTGNSKAGFESRSLKDNFHDKSLSLSPQRHTDKEMLDFDSQTKHDIQQRTTDVSTSKTRSRGSQSASPQKQKSIEIEDTRPAVRNPAPLIKQDSRSFSLGNEEHFTSEPCQRKISYIHPNEKRRDIPYIKRISITSTHY